MRRFAALALASTLFAASAYAADANQPLAAGKPAGVKQAQLAGGVMILGLAIVAGGIALVVSQGSSGNNIAASTTSTAP